MSFYHLQANITSRAKGQNAVRAAAYRSASRLADQRTGRIFDFSAKSDVVASEILAPPGVSPRVYDRSSFWNAVEARERRRDAIVARELLVFLPCELDPDAAALASRRFAMEALVRRGFVVDLNLHRPNGPRNPHAHLLFCERPVRAGGEGEEIAFGPKDATAKGPAWLHGVRRDWADHINAELALAGLEIRLDPQSFRAQGLELLPKRRLSIPSAKRRLAGDLDEAALEDLARSGANGDAITRSPEIGLRALSRTQPSFSRDDLLRFLRRHSEDERQVERSLGAVLSSSDLVLLGRDRSGSLRYTSKDALGLEEALELRARDLASRRTGRGPQDRDADPALRLVRLKDGAEDAREAAELFAPTLLGAPSPRHAREIAAAIGREVYGVSTLMRRWTGPGASQDLEQRILMSGAPLLSAIELRALLDRAGPHDQVVLLADGTTPEGMEAGAPFRRLEAAIGAYEVVRGEGRPRLERRLEPEAQQSRRTPAEAFAALRGFEPAGDVGEALLDLRRRQHQTVLTRQTPAILKEYDEVAPLRRAAAEGQALSPASARRLRRAGERLLVIRTGATPDRDRSLSDDVRARHLGLAGQIRPETHPAFELER